MVKINIRYFGYSAFKVIEENGKNVLIDPCLTGTPGRAPSPVSLDEVGDIDLILVTHAAPDHLGDEDREVIKATLKHLGLWLVKSKPAPKAHAPPARNQSESGQAGYVLDQFSQLPRNDDHLYRDPDYPWDAYFQS